MNWEWWVSIACWIGVLAGGALVAMYLRRAAAYQEITRKLYAREPLTPREQALLDRIP